MRAAAIQLNSTADVDATSRPPSGSSTLPPRPAPSWSCCRRSGALLGPARCSSSSPSRSTARSRGRARLGARARDHLLAGSVAERTEGRSGSLNTSLLIDARRRDRRRPTGRSTCSTSTSAGSATASPSTSAPATSRRAPAPALEVGLTVCYDLRFPELYRILALRGARVITVPSAFTAATGRDHWEVLLRARAIENQLFVVAANQFGEAPPHYSSWGTR